MTVTLISAWITAIFVYHGLTIYVVKYSKAVDIDTYNHQTVSLFLQ